MIFAILVITERMLKPIHQSIELLAIKIYSEVHRRLEPRMGQTKQVKSSNKIKIKDKTYFWKVIYVVV
jgi:hypothetical protein